jgi:poly(3-hydroxybutyrate) depolymerase
MTAVMLATYPETFTAGAMIAGLPYGAASNMWEAAYAMSFGSGLTSKELGENVRGASPGGSWPRISVWHGSRDSTVSPEAGDNLVQQWTNVHAVEGHASSAMTQDGREYSVWFDAHGRRKVEHHVIAGMTHGTPLNTRGPAACGTVGPYLLEIGISSSLEIASDWLAPVDC